MLRENQMFYYTHGSVRIRQESAHTKQRRLAVRHQQWAQLAARAYVPALTLKEWQQHEEHAARQARRERPSRPQRRVRKMPSPVLRRHILALIVASDHSSVCKDDLVRQLQVAEHAVDQVLGQLNRKGVLFQRRHEFAHDTNRNPLFYGSASGWASDVIPYAAGIGPGPCCTVSILRALHSSGLLSSVHDRMVHGPS